MITEEELQAIERGIAKANERYGADMRRDDMTRCIAEVRRLINELDLAARGVITNAIVRSARRAERERCAKALWAEGLDRSADFIRALPEED